MGRYKFISFLYKQLHYNNVHYNTRNFDYEQKLTKWKQLKPSLSRLFPEDSSGIHNIATALEIILGCMVHIEDYIFIQNNVNYTLINNKLRVLNILVLV